MRIRQTHNKGMSGKKTARFLAGSDGVRASSSPQGSAEKLHPRESFVRLVDLSEKIRAADPKTPVTTATHRDWPVTDRECMPWMRHDRDTKIRSSVHWTACYTQAKYKPSGCHGDIIPGGGGAAFDGLVTGIQTPVACRLVSVLRMRSDPEFRSSGVDTGKRHT